MDTSVTVTEAFSSNGITGSRVLREIRLAGRISRVDIARNLGLNKSTVTKIVTDFMDLGLIQVVAEGSVGPKGGRKPKFLTLDPDFGCVLGVEIRTDTWIAVAVDLQGRIVEVERHTLELGDRRVVEIFLDIVGTMRHFLSEKGYRVLGVGLGLAGIVNHIDGAILQSNPLRIDEPVPVYEEASARLGLPVFMDNDANCGCWAELARAGGRRASNSLFVLGEFRLPNTRDFDYQSVSVGLGFVLGGSVHHGLDYSAGEFRSILWQPGNTTQFSVSDTEVDRVRSDPELHERMFKELCDHIAFLVNSLNLNQVVFSDSFEFSEDYVKQICSDAIAANWSYSGPVRCSVEISDLGEQTVAYGAAGMFLEHLFDVPDVDSSYDRRPRGVRLLGEIQHAGVFKQSP